MNGRILIKERDPGKFDVSRRALVVGVRGLPREQMSMYQGSLEGEFVRVLRDSGAFQEVLRGEFRAEDVDLELRFGPATLWMNQRMHPLYLPLSLVTIGLYPLFGGPANSHFQQYAVDLTGLDPTGREIFVLHFEEWYHHGLSIYNKENVGRLCRGPDSGRFVRLLVEGLNDELETGVLQ